MNLIQHYKAAKMCKKNFTVLDVCCGRSMMLPLLRYYASDIKEYIGVDIEEKNINEAKRYSGVKKMEMPMDEYYPFKVNYVLSNVANMADKIEHNSVDFTIYTSAIEHMHKDDGYASLQECFKIMKPNSQMFLSCPNTPGNGYNTQYRAHVYEWGYDEIKKAFNEIGFTIKKEVGITSTRTKLREYYYNQSPEYKKLFDMFDDYLPNDFLTALLSIPCPENSDEMLFVLEKRSEHGFFS
jgi:2-polyprenyl-3-methyl-5-hydroxy-6-metoxy-1,4-benzoquinol methylase